jgi:ABC-type transport system substrate-binding protein
VQVAVPTTLTPAFLDEMTSLPDVQSQIGLSATFLQLEMASGATSVLTSDVRFAIALSVDRQALVDEQADWALSSVLAGSSHIYSQGQSAYHAAPLTTTTTVPGAAPTTSSSTSTTAIDQGGSVNFPTTPDPTEVAALMTASGFTRVAPSGWLTALGQPLSLSLVVDAGDPWAAATAAQLASQLQSAGFAVTVTQAASAVAAGEVLAAGSADLALIPMTTSPFLSESVAWYSDLLGPPGQDGSEDWTNYDSSTFNQLVTTASQDLYPVTAAADYMAADAQLWSDVVALPLFTEPSVVIWSRKVGEVSATPDSTSFLWYAQYWAVRVRESTSNTTPALPNP